MEASDDNGIDNKEYNYWYRHKSAFVDSDAFAESDVATLYELSIQRDSREVALYQKISQLQQQIQQMQIGTMMGPQMLWTLLGTMPHGRMTSTQGALSVPPLMREETQQTAEQQPNSPPIVVSEQPQTLAPAPAFNQAPSQLQSPILQTQK